MEETHFYAPRGKRFEEKGRRGPLYWRVSKRKEGRSLLFPRDLKTRQEKGGEENEVTDPLRSKGEKRQRRGEAFCLGGHAQSVEEEKKWEEESNPDKKERSSICLRGGGNAVKKLGGKSRGRQYLLNIAGKEATRSLYDTGEKKRRPRQKKKACSLLRERGNGSSKAAPRGKKEGGSVCARKAPLFRPEIDSRTPGRPKKDKRSGGG